MTNNRLKFIKNKENNKKAIEKLHFIANVNILMTNPLFFQPKLKYEVTVDSKGKVYFNT